MFTISTCDNKLHIPPFKTVAMFKRALTSLNNWAKKETEEGKAMEFSTV